jgi:hypothetical protein
VKFPRKKQTRGSLRCDSGERHGRNSSADDVDDERDDHGESRGRRDDADDRERDDSGLVLQRPLQGHPRDGPNDRTRRRHPLDLARAMKRAGLGVSSFVATTHRE